jgi:hypothetical protein
MNLLDLTVTQLKRAAAISEKKGSGPLLAYTNIDGLRTNGEGQ